MEPPKSTTWLNVDCLKDRVEFLSLTTIAEMRKIPYIPFPDDAYPKAVEFAMIVRNEFTKRLASELAGMSSNTDHAFIRVRFHKILESLRDEIVEMADSGTGWLEKQLEHVASDTSDSSGVYHWADRYLGAMLISIGV
jgi:hypothetical protein